MAQTSKIIGITCQPNSKKTSQVDDERVYYDRVLSPKEMEKEQVLCPMCGQQFLLVDIPFKNISLLKRILLALFVFTPFFLSIVSAIGLILLPNNGDWVQYVFIFGLILSLMIGIPVVVSENAQNDVINRAIYGRNKNRKIKIEEDGSQNFTHAATNNFFYPRSCTRDIHYENEDETYFFGIKCITGSSSGGTDLYGTSRSLVSYKLAPIKIRNEGIPIYKIHKIEKGQCPVCHQALVIKISRGGIALHNREKTFVYGVNYAINQHEITPWVHNKDTAKPARHRG